jgi:Ca-activated chloride channel family protein
MAEVASVAGVRIYPIGIGSPQGTSVEIDGFTVATALDEQMLTEIAAGTGGTYFQAEDTAALDDIYENLDLRITVEPERTEVTAAVTGLSIALLVAGAALSLAWFGRLV